MEATARVKAIHGAVEQASDVLLMDMPYDQTEVALLKRTGFTGSENVRDFDDHRINHERAKYYSQKYPMNKFITEHQLEKIRGKYGLITRVLADFKGNIPSKNISELSSFRIQRADIAQPRIEIASNFGGSIETIIQMFERYSPQMITGVKRDMEVEINRAPMPLITARESVARKHGAPSWEQLFIDNAAKMEEKKKAAEEKKQAAPIAILSLADVVAEHKALVTITADRELFNIPNRDLDPIVTVAVNGGYLVVTAWGAEAADQDIVNPKMN